MFRYRKLFFTTHFGNSNRTRCNQFRTAHFAPRNGSGPAPDGTVASHVVSGHIAPQTRAAVYTDGPAVGPRGLPRSIAAGRPPPRLYGFPYCLRRTSGRDSPGFSKNIRGWERAGKMESAKRCVHPFPQKRKLFVSAKMKKGLIFVSIGSIISTERLTVFQRWKCL